MRRHIAAVALALTVLAPTARASNTGNIVLKHCVSWAADNRLCFLELLKPEENAAHILVLEENFEALLNVPWDDTEFVIEVATEQDYAEKDGQTTRGFDYDLSLLSSEQIWVVAWATIEGPDVLASADEAISQVVFAANSGEGVHVLEEQLEYRDRGGMVGHSPDDSRCTQAILGGAVKWAGSVGSAGAKLGASIPTPVPGGGAIAGGVLGASVGFVGGAIYASNNSPYCPHTHDDDGSNNENDSTSVDEGTSDSGGTVAPSGDDGSGNDNAEEDDKGDGGAGNDSDGSDSDDDDDNESTDSGGDTEEVTREEGTTVDPGASGSEFKPYPFQWTGSRDGVILLADTVIASYVIEKGELHGGDGVTDDDGEGSEDAEEPKQLQIDDSYLVVDPI